MKAVVNELAKFYRKINFQSDDYFLEPKSEGSKMERLFHYYANTSLEEQEIQSELYENGQSTKAFMMLRKDLVLRLSRYVLVMDPNKVGQSRRLQQFVMVARTLLSPEYFFMLVFTRVVLIWPRKQ